MSQFENDDRTDDILFNLKNNINKNFPTNNLKLIAIVQIALVLWMIDIIFFQYIFGGASFFVWILIQYMVNVFYKTENK